MERPVDLMETLANLSEKDLITREREIAARHIDRFPWGSVTWAFLNLACWLSLWPLTMMGILPLWAAFLIACANLALSYLPSHEAQHDIIARPGSKLRWLNELVGHISTIPLLLPYRVARLTHLEHHKHANHPDLDPDYGTHAETALQSVWQTIQQQQPRTKSEAYGEALKRIGRPEVVLDAVVYELAYYAIMIALCWAGHALEAALIWWLPKHVGLIYIRHYLSWAPHNPGMGQGRYKDTRSFRSAVGNVLSMGMQYHIVHHLHPRIPLMRTPRAYWEMRDILEARGCRMDNL